MCTAPGCDLRDTKKCKESLQSFLGRDVCTHHMFLMAKYEAASMLNNSGTVK